MSSNNIKIFLIRHTESQYNFAMKKAVGVDREVCAHQELVDVKFSHDLIDCGISQRGIEQCILACQQTKKINFKIVLASPLKRALISAKEFFKDHPSNPKYIIQPLLTQMMLSSCDIGAKILESKQIYDFDFSFLDNITYKKLWVLQNLPQKQQLLDLIKKRAKSEEDIHENGHLYLADIMKEKFPEFYETLQNVKERSLKLKQKIIDTYSKQLKQGQQMALVMHFRMAECLSAKKFDQKHQPVGGLHLKNADLTEVVLQ